MPLQSEIQDKIDLLSSKTQPNTIPPTMVGEILTDLNETISTVKLFTRHQGNSK